MFKLVEALRYRCLRDVQRDISRFQILVGPNASGKTTFLDVVGLLGELLRRERHLHETLYERAPNFLDLVWMKQDSSFELAVELEIPASLPERFALNGFARARYEVAIGLDDSDTIAILGENLWLKPVEQPSVEPQTILEFPIASSQPRKTMFRPDKARNPTGWRNVVKKKPESGSDYYQDELKNWSTQFRIGPRRLALQNLPEDEQRFPVATWVRRILMEGVQRVVLNSERMRDPSPVGAPSDFLPDGSNLPWVVHRLQESNAERFQDWLSHLQTALPDVASVDTIERPEDRKRYLRVHYRNGLVAPSWSVSDGTLRLLALTLLAYADAPGHVYLIEEPENGIHPQAVEAIYQSLTAGSESQILCATHSPVILSLTEPSDVLCFGKTTTGEVDIVRGDEHPRLREWKRGIDLGTLFAAGVLG